MVIDFSPVKNGSLKLAEFAKSYTITDLKRVTNASIDRMLALIADLDDDDVTFDPVDPEANDPHAIAGEEHIGWNLAHLIVHTTASSEEWATYASILARGIPYPAEPRLRHETEWKTVRTKAQCIQRLEESRRIRLSYLNAMPDTPDLTITRGLSPRFIERNGEMNAVGCVLYGLQHEVGHYAQFEEVRRQALEVKQQAV